MKRLLDILRDLGVALALGFGIGLIVGLLFFGAGALIGGMAKGLTAARSILLLIGGFTLVFAALLLLKGGNLPKDAFRLRPWKHRDEAPVESEPLPLFRTVGRQYTSILIAVGILLAAAIPDYILMVHPY